MNKPADDLGACIDEAAARLRAGLKSCRSVIDDYRAKALPDRMRLEAPVVKR